MAGRRSPALLTTGLAGATLCATGLAGAALLLPAPGRAQAPPPGTRPISTIPAAPLTPRRHYDRIASASPATPDGRSLLAVALAEAEVADSFAALAARESTPLAAMKRYASYVLHALDPALAPSGPGTGYGIRPAAEEIAREARAVLATDSLSPRLLMRTEHVTAAADNVSRWVREAIGLVEEVRAASTRETALPRARRLASVARAIHRGMDPDGDGLRGWPDGEEGLEQIGHHVALLRRGEGWSG